MAGSTAGHDVHWRGAADARILVPRRTHHQCPL